MLCIYEEISQTNLWSYRPRTENVSRLKCGVSKDEKWTRSLKIVSHYDFSILKTSPERWSRGRESEKWESDGFSIYINSKVSIQGREWCEEIKWMVFSVFMFILNVSLLHLLFLSLLFTHLYFVFYVRSSVCACCVLVACCKVEILHSRLRRAHWCSFESLSSRCFQIISYLFLYKTTTTQLTRTSSNLSWTIYKLEIEKWELSWKLVRSLDAMCCECCTISRGPARQQKKSKKERRELEVFETCSVEIILTLCAVLQYLETTKYMLREKRNGKIIYTSRVLAADHD